MKKTLLFIAFLITNLFWAQNNDCVSAIPICSNANITLTPSGIGNDDEGNVGCLNGENNSIWFTFSTLTAGTLTFVINPVNNVDYDWALYGPDLNCTQIQTATPLRCSYDAPGPGQYATGLNMTSLDTSEGAATDNLGNSSDGMVKYIDVVPGQVYYLLVDNFSPTISQFSLTFGGSAGLLTPFDDPVLQPYPFIVPGANHDGKIDICGNPVMYNFSTLTAQILNNNPNFIVKYYNSATDALDDVNAITTPVSVSTANTYHYVISYSDPTSPASFLNKCKQFGTINFVDRSFALNTATITECSNNNSGTALYDLTSVNIGLTPNLNVKYYPSMPDLNAGTNEITIPYAYTSAEGSVFVKATNEFDCVTIAEIKLKFHPIVTINNDAILRSCFIETNPSTALFNLTVATVTGQTGITKEYYPSMTDAVNGTNPIPNPTAYIAPSGVAYVKVINAQGCYAVAKVTLVVIPPVYSTTLKDKVICIEDKTTLDAGIGFNGYLWSTGATTQTISDVGVGTYWVKLKTGDCVTTQTVKVYPAEQPVISNIDIATTTVTVNVIGGTPPYKYSMDNVNWQDSNVFENITRGDHPVYVKDAYDCEPIEVTIVVPNLINVITPNGDGVNDIIDYSALAGKQGLVLSIFDRYGTKIHQADKMNGYKWDGTVGGKKVPTGTYWYSVTWNENNKKNTAMKFSGWVMVKNRD
ncbi:T9SS type B sorting domain-containing protein [Chryseobacterium oryctis]|uniref:T9SS type B sorting domain-containing protein n=1 Tax=Chryseobacterium oryctis TaxID=2952618 RepID=A0ABT3HKZ0_9FLAO|nr:T9SS type B sorting domain-containing protein [Chryseobacterium oryctis]MCW3160431.1 T9SS type B sorting domain-containing protein [Chryseobacterium oryctis]